MELGEAIRIRHGFAFKSHYFSDNGQFVVLTPGNFHEGGGFRLRPDKNRFYSDTVQQKHILRKGDLIIAMTEQGPGLLGSAALVPHDGKYLHNQRIGLVDRINADTLDKQFLYYLFNTKPVRAQLSGSATGTKVRHTSPERIYRVEVVVPADTKVQRRIAAALRAYDHLIENNRRRIPMLERRARLIYEEWFVRLRFPGCQLAQFTNGVPGGWTKKTLGDVIAKMESGARPKGGATDAGVPSIGAENVMGIGNYDYSRVRYIPDEYFHTMRQGVVHNRDVVLYKDGANIGRSSYFGDGFPHDRCAVNEHVFIIRALPDIGQNFLYFWISKNEIRQGIANLNANTAQPGISKQKLGTVEFVAPSREILHRFNETVEPTVRQIFLLALENQRLAQARDLLLPRLMKGEIAV